MESALLKEIGEFAEDMDINIYVIGGYVRDQLIHYPSKDIDLVIDNGDCIEFANALRNYFKEKDFNITDVHLYPHYGTAQFRINDIEVEIVRARKESYTATTFKPRVEEGTLKDDIIRRDFTINTLAVPLNPSQEHHVLDLTGLGRQDLSQRIIRTPKNPLLTFYDDPTRIFRAIRFASKYNFTIEPVTQAALAGFFYDATIKTPSLEERHTKFYALPIERIRDELVKILIQKEPHIYFRLMKQLGLLRFVMPGLDLLFYIPQNPKYHKDDVGSHSLTVLAGIQKSDLAIRLAALLHDIGKTTHTSRNERGEIIAHGHEHTNLPEVALRRLKMPSKIIADVSLMVKLHMRLYPLLKSEASIRKFIRDANGILDEVLDLIVADGQARIQGADSQFLGQVDYIRNYDEEEKKVLQQEIKPLNGDEIIALLNYPKPQSVPNWNKVYGIKLGQIIKLLFDAIVSGEIKNTKEDAITFIKSLPRSFVYETEKR
jgi:tRNA nucleotidyltransferase/poly(A) polymerase